MVERRFHREAGLPVLQPTIERAFGVMAERLLLRTDDGRIADAAEASFGRFPVPAPRGEPLLVELYRDAAATADAAAAPRTIVNRFHDGLYLVTGPGPDLAVARVDAGTALGFVSEATIADTATLRYAYVEAMALSMLSRSRGYLTVHAAGVARDGVGVLLHGPAGAGKSTLTMACARRGFDVFAEDAAFVRADGDGLQLWGMPWTQRLLPDAVDWFPELRGIPARLRPNGELKIEVDLDRVHPGRAVPCVRAGLIVLLVRGSGGPTRLEPVELGGPLGDAQPGAASLGIHWPFAGGWTETHRRVAERLVTSPAYRLHMNGPVDEAVDALELLLADRSAVTTAR